MLTDKKRKYAEARLAGRNRKESAICAGCPERSAKQAGYRYEKDPEVQAAMARMRMGDAPQPAPVAHVPAPADGPLEFMRGVMNDPVLDARLRLDAAKALAAFTVKKPGDEGKKDRQKAVAEAVGAGRFKPAAPPRLVRNNG